MVPLPLMPLKLLNSTPNHQHSLLKHGPLINRYQSKKNLKMVVQMNRMTIRSRSATGGRLEGVSTGDLPIGTNQKCAILGASIIWLCPQHPHQIFFLKATISTTTCAMSTMAEKSFLSPMKELRWREAEPLQQWGGACTTLYSPSVQGWRESYAMVSIHEPASWVWIWDAWFSHTFTATTASVATTTPATPSSGASYSEQKLCNGWTWPAHIQSGKFQTYTWAAHLTPAWPESLAVLICANQLPPCYVWAERSTRLEWEGYDQVALRVVHEASP